MRGDQPAIWTTLICALAVTLAGCGPPDARGSPPAPDLTTSYEQATDSTGVFRAAWQQPSPPADLFRYTLTPIRSDTAEVDSLSVAVEVAQRDTAFALTFCVWGVAQRGSREAVGGEACATETVPPLPLEAPGVIDSIQTTFDTSSVAAAIFDSARVFDLTENAVYPTGQELSVAPDTLRLHLLPYRDGEPYLCGNGYRGRGWYRASLPDGFPPEVATDAAYIADDCDQYPIGTNTVVAEVFGSWLVARIHSSSGHTFDGTRGAWTAVDPNEDQTAARIAGR